MNDARQEALSPAEEALLDRLDAELGRLRWGGQGETASLACDPEESALLEALRRLARAADEWKSASPPAAAGETGLYPAQPGVPARIGRYEILGQLGAGGMGAVYRARDAHLGRDVAVKVPHQGLAGRPQDLQRFLREARAAAHLRHPNICPIYDVGDESCPFLVMPLIEGEPLSGRLRSAGKLPAADAVRLVCRISGALEALHAAGIIHRDLKPANVLLDAGGEPLLTDFGLARTVEQAGELTREGVIVGTPFYMAPEQASGKGECGPAADQYSLAVVLYQALTGQVPFSSPSVPTLLHQILYDPVPSAQDMGAAVPPALEAILRRALAKDPAQRFPALADFRRALEGWLEGRPAPSAMPPAVPPASPRRWRVGAVVLTAALAVAGAWAIMQSGKAPQAGPDRPAAEKPGDPRPGLALTGTLHITLSSDPESGPVTRTRLSIEKDGTLPVRDGELVRLEAEFNQAVHPYLLWIDTAGAVIPLYPWDSERSDKLWKAPLVKGSGPVERIVLPESANRGFPAEGATGLQTVVLLARRTALPDPAALEALVGRLPASPLTNDKERREAVWLSLPQGERLTRHDKVNHRGIKTGQSRLIDGPLIGLLEERLRGHFDYMQAVRFAHVTGRPEKAGGNP